MTITRRNALLTGAAAAASLPVMTRSAFAAGDLDIAIVGGGLSGIYAALRLATAKPTLSMRLFEMSDRIGGRLRSIAFPQAPGLIGEAGGACFPNSHRHVVGLARTLNLTMRLAPLDLPQDRLNLKGHNIPIAHTGAGADALPYEMPAEHQNLSTWSLRKALALAAPETDGLTPAQWRAKRLTLQVKGKPLSAWQASALLAETLSPGERDFLCDTARLDEAALQGNALGLFDAVLGSADSEGPFFSIAGGFEQLPHTIADRLAPFGDVIAKGEHLVSLSVPEGKGGAFKLAFEDASGRRSQVTAKTVILALPRRALEAIPDFRARSAKPFAQTLATASAVPSCKAFLLYDAPWWKDLGIRGGRSLTDTSAGQFVALGAEEQRLASETTGGFGLLETTTEGSDVAALRALAGSARPGAAGLSWLDANSALAQDLQKQASATFGVPAPTPVAAAFQDWTVDPYGGGLAAWSTGADPLAVSDAMLQPLKGRALYVVGDTWSAHQNWAEGALEQAEAMLQKHFGLNEPGWIAS
ncbi:MAG TPA: FAD-dependent oxidoreductase [Rhizomicrobium sp.]|nr:FAD-dependent oxidoreductase [Rhizomicrobium sp.]